MVNSGSGQLNPIDPKGNEMAARNNNKLKIKIFADGADINGIKEMLLNPEIKGFTTNPTLMRKAGVQDYENFAKAVLEVVTELPVSFEVFADDLDGMEKQARRITSWGDNVNVKIPVTNTQGASTATIVERLSADGIQLNVTALMTLDQVRDVGRALHQDTPSIVSVFAGRVADTGIDPVPHMIAALEILKDRPKAELLWASPRELLNIIQADQIGCHIITVTNDVLKKMNLFGKNLGQLSLETVEMFYRDALAAGYSIATD
jgi:transaldolase